MATDIILTAGGTVTTRLTPVITGLSTPTPKLSGWKVEMYAQELGSPVAMPVANGTLNTKGVANPFADFVVQKQRGYRS